MSVRAALLFLLPGQQHGNFTAACTLALMPHDPWPRQGSVLLLNYSPPECTVLTHSNFTEFVVRTGGDSSS